MKAREFTEEEYGAQLHTERWPNQALPVCRDFNGRGTVYGIADHSGIMVTIHNPADPLEFVNWWIEWQIPTQQLAMLIMDAFPEAFSPTDYGFKAQPPYKGGK